MTETTDGMRRRGREGKADEMVQQRTMTTARARLLKGLALEEQRLEINGIATTVLEGGQGPLMVLLHGGIECGGAYWGPVISRLAESHRLVVPDAPGLGESEPVTRLDAAAFSDWLAALLRSTGRERPTLVAHSLLGSLAARFASQHGDRLRGLVLYGAPAVGPYRLPPGLQVAAIRFGLRPSGRNSERFARWAFLDLDLTRRQDREWYEAFDEYSRSRGAVPHVKRTMRQLSRPKRSRSPTPTSSASAARRRCCGAGTTGWCRCASPRRQAPVSAGRCT